MFFFFDLRGRSRFHAAPFGIRAGHKIGGATLDNDAWKSDDGGAIWVREGGLARLGLQPPIIPGHPNDTQADGS